MTKTYTQDEMSNIALQAIYIANAYNVHAASHNELPEHQEQLGHIETMHRIVGLGEIVHNIEELPAMKEINEQAAWPGVYEYEVVEPMGRWFAENSMCDDAEFEAELRKRTNAWFKGSNMEMNL